MKKTSKTEIILYLITGLLPLIGYYFLMTEYFKISPFEGYYLIITIYLVICYFLYPIAGIKLSEAIADKPSDRLLMPQSKMLISFIFAPFIFIFKRNK
ncbi:MAG: hypothetical protein PUG67_08715 [Peptoniphilaceae bacterium]|nr:hypothetical protein [Peptoniphilaceae bacterium]MDY6018690.1 hypothetical protein [Anaerococcus sp.]